MSDSNGELKEFYWLDGKWMHEKAGIEPDPGMHFGRTPAGLRYVTIPNDDGYKNCAVRLFVECGSINETEGEKGAAHLIEHMAFKSPAIGAQEFESRMKSLGITMGGALNAFTTHVTTTYCASLPDPDAAAIDSILEIMHSFAKGPVFEEKALAQEKTVIVSEMSTRTGKAADRVEKARAFLLEGTPYDTDIKGTIASTEAMTVDVLQGFFRKWYVPERMILAVCGTFDEEKCVESIRRIFDDIGPGGRLEYIDAIDYSRVAGLRAMSETTTLDVSGISVRLRPSNDIASVVIEDSPESLARINDMGLSTLLLSTLCAMKTTYLSDAGSSDHYAFVPIRGELRDTYEVRIGSYDGNWRATVAKASAFVRDMAAGGVLPEDFEAARELMVQVLQRDLDDECPARNNTDIITDLIENEIAGNLSRSHKDEIRCRLEALIAAKYETFVRFVVDVFSSENASIVLNANDKADTEEILAIWKQVAEEPAGDPLKEVHGIEKVSFPYLEPAARSTKPLNLEKLDIADEGLGVEFHRMDLGNGHEAYFCTSENLEEKGNTGFCLFYGGGTKQFGIDDLPAVMMGDRVVASCGIGRLNQIDSSKVCASGGISLSRSASSFRSILSVGGQSTSVDLMLEVMRACYAETVINENLLPNIRNGIRLARQKREDEKTVRGEFAEQNLKFLSLMTDRRVKSKTYDPESVTSAQMLDVIDREKKTGVITLYVTGEFDLVKTAQKVMDIFGDLPAPTYKRERKSPNECAVVPKGQHLEVPVPFDPKGGAVVQVFWERVISHSAKEMCMREILGALVRRRIFNRIRNRGNTYVVSSQFGSWFPSTKGVFSLSANCAASERQKFRRTLEDFGRELCSEKFDREEVDAVIASFTASLKAVYSTSEYWTMLLSAYKNDGEPFFKLSEMLQACSEITPESLQEELQGIFASEPASLIVYTSAVEEDK